MEFAHKINEKYSNIERVIYSIAIPLIGSNLFSKLENMPAVQKEYLEISQTDNLDYPLLMRLANKEFCSVGLNKLLKIMDDLPCLDEKKHLHYGNLKEYFRK